jgi:hypothetical protein
VEMNPGIIFIPESGLKFALRRWPIVSIGDRRSEVQFHTTTCRIGAITANVVWQTAESSGVPR